MVTSVTLLGLSKYSGARFTVEDTIGAQLAVLYREVWVCVGIDQLVSRAPAKYFRGRFVHRSVWLGQQTVSS